MKYIFEKRKKFGRKFRKLKEPRRFYELWWAIIPNLFLRLTIKYELTSTDAINLRNIRLTIVNLQKNQHFLKKFYLSIKAKCRPTYIVVHTLTYSCYIKGSYFLNKTVNIKFQDLRILHLVINILYLHELSIKGLCHIYLSINFTFKYSFMWLFVDSKNAALNITCSLCYEKC